jgi:hypothetical protein
MSTLTQASSPLAERLEAFIDAGASVVYSLRSDEATSPAIWDALEDVLAALPLESDVYHSASALVRQARAVSAVERLAAATDVMRVLRRISAEMRRFPEIRGQAGDVPHVREL